ncbi:adenosylmethionine--8-amino-7-oxononanoate transaminase [Nocardioides jensenii]|uniref:adenosylmethionine--8-amino-7-oxononanoate transaminase n=1 Tax=Nocardioides jensenii TaxID=1843 RepID=UPI00082C20F3|nr:adenosylmethionine--8-amino-7-oxononanoate transaminase [Nocardioides jensenii]
MTTSPATALLAYDREHLWHPYTSMTDPAPTRLVSGADGVRLTLDGADVIDAMSSWWSAIHGYRHPVLDAAIANQAREFTHVMFGGLTHEPAVELARRLVDLTPDPLQHVFLADSGSVSVEVALKMALQHQRGIGRPERTRFLTVLGGYHGDTCGCMGVCDPVGGMHSMFTGLLPRHVFGQRPPPPGGDVDTWAAGFDALADEHAPELAGIVVEPLLQGAGGMHPYDPECLRVMRDVADRHGLVLIFDEIATGFGRTGHLVVSGSGDHGVTPDILCLGKALTGGYLTLAATLCTPAIAAGISASESGVLMHGPTFMGNPLACAVAAASIDLLLDRGWEQDVTRINTGLNRGLSPLRQQPGVSDVRTLGAVGVVQLDHPVDVAAATEAALASGVWVRPFRDLIYTMPPYISTDVDVAEICAAIGAAVRAG